MADLYSTLGAGSSRRVLTQSDVTGPETTWLVIRNLDENWYGGESPNIEPQRAPSDSFNHRAIVECIQQYCEVYEVIRPWYAVFAIKVRLSSVPYAAGEGRNIIGQNSRLTELVQAHPGLGARFYVYNGSFQGTNVNWT